MEVAYQLLLAYAGRLFLQDHGAQSGLAGHEMEFGLAVIEIGGSELGKVRAIGRTAELQKLDRVLRQVDPVGGGGGAFDAYGDLGDAGDAVFASGGLEAAGQRGQGGPIP